MANTLVEKVNRQNSNFMNIYRNAPSEVITAFNNSILDYIDVNKQNTDEALYLLGLVIQLVLAICLCLILCSTIYLIINIDRNRNKF